MMSHRLVELLNSLRVRLVLLVALAVVPLLALYLHMGASERRRAVAEAEEDALRLARSVSARERQLFEGANHLLLAVAQMPEVSSGSRPRRDARLASLLKEYREYINIGVIDPEGIVIGSALPVDGVVDLSDRSYFRRARETRRFAIGDYQIGRITQRASVNFGLPILNDDGEVRYVVFAAMDLAWIRRLAVVAGPPEGTVLTLIDGNGTILSRSVQPHEWIGRKINMNAGFGDAMVRGEGVAEVEDVDDVRRLCAVRRLGPGSAGNVYLSVGIPTSVVLAGVEESQFRHLFAVVIVSLISLALAWFGGHALIARRVQRLVRTASRLASGDLGARARDTMSYGRDEIGELARVFDVMAEAIKQRADQIEHTQNELMSAVEATIEGWARALERRDSDTQGHTRRVAEMSVRLARAMGLDEDQVVHIRRGALLHDIGKMGIPDSILLKPGPLNDEEWEVMRRHPTYAYEWLSHIPLLKPALEIPQGHHERWDGSGYPRGLVGTQIPVAARIFAVVDVYDGVTSDRPYRDAWSEEHALHYIRESSGTLFDPRVVDAFIELKARTPADAEVVYRPSVKDASDEEEWAEVLGKLHD